MNKSKTFYKRGFWIVLVLNVFLIVLNWTNFQRPKNHKAHLVHVLKDLKENLKLSTHQTEEIDAIFKLHQREIDSIRLKTRQIHEQAFKNLKKIVNSHAMKSEFEIKQPSFEAILFKHHLRILAILTPNQQKKYILDLQNHRPKGPPNLN
jgi:Spy/CpxP family protein refolding chaperone